MRLAQPCMIGATMNTCADAVMVVDIDFDLGTMLPAVHHVQRRAREFVRCSTEGLKVRCNNERLMHCNRNA